MYIYNLKFRIGRCSLCYIFYTSSIRGGSNEVKLEGAMLYIIL